MHHRIDCHLPRAQTDLLGEAEHDGWMQWHFDNGWSKSDQRADEMKLHDLLIPYSTLKPKERAKDKDAILHYPDIAELAGLKIVPIAAPNPESDRDPNL